MSPLRATLPWLLAVVSSHAPAQAQQLSFRVPADPPPAVLAEAMQALARQTIAVYHDPDRQSYLRNLFRLQLVAGRYADARASIAELGTVRDLQYGILARAGEGQAQGRLGREEAFAQAFRQVFAALDDRASALVIRAITVDRVTYGFRDALRAALERQKDKTTIELADALALIRAWQVDDAYRTFAELAPPLIAADDARRYTIEKRQVATPDGASVSVLVVRPRSAPARLPALLEFTIYADTVASLNEARRSGSNGYVGVEGFTRGKMRSPDQPVPYEHDGADAAAVIDWIAEQPWSDGRVGMFGGSYNGFTQWAAAKHLPPALKAIMPSVSVAPGIDVPMEGNVFQSFVYYWPLYAATGPMLNSSPLTDRARWERMNQSWFSSGQAYRALPRIDGTPNPIFERWLDHPSYDGYWQAMIPYAEDFGRIGIPVLTTTGYYDGGQIGALYYFQQHYRYNPRAEHYLLIGPYDHGTGQRGTVNALGEPRDVVSGYSIDSVAHLDLGEIRYQWFDYVLKHGKKPALLRDRVNYEVMGANVWRHAPSIGAMSDGSLELRLGSPAGGSVSQTLDLAERAGSDPFRLDLIADTVDTWNGIMLRSRPLREAMELSGLFSGTLELITNKQDFDFEIDLYERMPEGKYFKLSYYLARASYVSDRSHRRLLTPGKPQRVIFRAGRMTSRKLGKGSRVVAVLGLIKSPYAQINYGTGKDVSEETIADAAVPLRITWLSGSVIRLPVRRSRP